MPAWRGAEPGGTGSQGLLVPAGCQGRRGRWAGRPPAASLTERLVRGPAPPASHFPAGRVVCWVTLTPPMRKLSPGSCSGSALSKLANSDVLGLGGVKTGGQHRPHSLVCWGHALHARAGTLLPLPAPACWLWFCCHCLPRSLLSTYCVCRPGQAEEGPSTRKGDLGFFLFVCLKDLIYLSMRDTHTHTEAET